MNGPRVLSRLPSTFILNPARSSLPGGLVAPARFDEIGEPSHRSFGSLNARFLLRLYVAAVDDPVQCRLETEHSAARNRCLRCASRESPTSRGPAMTSVSSYSRWLGHRATLGPGLCETRCRTSLAASTSSRTSRTLAVRNERRSVPNCSPVKSESAKIAAISSRRFVRSPASVARRIRASILWSTASGNRKPTCLSRLSINRSPGSTFRLSTSPYQRLSYQRPTLEICLPHVCLIC